MGKVITEFDLGWPGAISRSVDDIVICMKNTSTEPIPFGVPVFLSSGGDGVEPFANTESGGTPQTFDTFVGFSVRSAAKTPDTYPLSQEWSSIAGEQAGAWNPGDMVEIITQNNAKPSRDWLKHAVTPTAKAKIRSYFKKQMKEEKQ